MQKGVWPNVDKQEEIYYHKTLTSYFWRKGVGDNTMEIDRKTGT